MLELVDAAYWHVSKELAYRHGLEAGDGGCGQLTTRLSIGRFLYAHLYVRRKNKGPAFLRALVLYGAGTRSRTRDLLIMVLRKSSTRREAQLRQGKH